MYQLFTPGPWVAEISEKGGPSIVTADEPHILVAKLDNQLMPMMELVGNARLVSLAPDLYAKLSKIVEEFSRTGKVGVGSVLAAQTLLAAVDPKFKKV